MKRIEFNINGMRLRIIHGAKDVNVSVVIKCINCGSFEHINNEPELRLKLQDLMEIARCPVTMLLNGNTVWPYSKTMKDFRRLVNANDTTRMTKHLYGFFNLCCGTIAHYDKYGWAHEYPDNEALKQLFRRNEYGQSVVNGMPGWKTDAIKIAKDMEEILEGVE